MLAKRDCIVYWEFPVCNLSMQFSHLEGPESRSPPGGAWWARTPSRSCAGLMEGRELISRLSASVLLLLKVELPESMLVPCPGSMQGVLSHTFFCYTDALFCNETNKYEAFFSTNSLFWIFYLFCIYGYLHESLEYSCLCVSSTGITMLAAHLAFF